MRRIFFGPGKVTIRVEPSDDQPGVTVTVGESLGSWLELDFEDVVFRDGNDPFAESNPPLGEAPTRRSITFGAMGEVAITK